MYRLTRFGLHQHDVLLLMGFTKLYASGLLLYTTGQGLLVHCLVAVQMPQGGVLHGGGNIFGEDGLGPTQMQDRLFIV